MLTIIIVILIAYYYKFHHNLEDIIIDIQYKYHVAIGDGTKCDI